MHPLSVIDVKVTVTSSLNCPSEMLITLTNRVPTQAPESDDEEDTYHPDISEDDDSIMTKKVLILNVNIFNSRLQITYLSSDMRSHKRRTIGEELLFYTHSLKLETKIGK